MPVKFEWENDEKTIMRVVASGVWNWNEFHKAMRVMTFAMDRVSHSVETIIDLRGSAKLPAGAFGHIRSLGKRTHPNGTDRAVIIGLDESVAGPLGGAKGVYQEGERLLRFVDSDEEALAVIGEWWAKD